MVGELNTLSLVCTDIFLFTSTFFSFLETCFASIILVLISILHRNHAWDGRHPHSPCCVRPKKIVNTVFVALQDSLGLVCVQLLCLFYPKCQIPMSISEISPY